jgi:(5-formylfuran-3-yl)methyl phosphate synthase
LASLLVSVRSPAEARAAVAGGADIIDVKEPLRGSLGRADACVWQDVRAVVPHSIPVSVALGEFNEWLAPEHVQIPETAWAGIDYCKLGLADAPAGWVECWAQTRRDLRNRALDFPDWVAVVYLDWQDARAPHPDTIIRAALGLSECRVVLFDTWSKSTGTRLDRSWKDRVERVQNSGRLVALAGSLDLVAIERLRDWQPDILAVRGAACAGGDRLASIDTARVARLVQAARFRAEPEFGPGGVVPAQTSNRTP